MRPILFSLGPLHVYSFGAMVAFGVIVSLFFMTRQARRDGFPHPDQAVDLVLVTLVGGFLGARLLYGIQNFDWYLTQPLRILALWEGGLIFYGGVLGSLLALFVFMRVKKISYLAGLDFLLPYVALTHAFGRIGCFLNGCCYGRLCNLPWAVKFPELPNAVHPTQLYEALFNVCLFLFLRDRTPRKRFVGEIAVFYFMFYAMGRFAIEFWRSDNPFFGPFTYNQWLSLLTLVSAFFLLRICPKKKS